MELLVSQESSFLTTHDKFYRWKLFTLEDISENVTGYGYHNYTYTVR